MPAYQAYNRYWYNVFCIWNSKMLGRSIANFSPVIKPDWACDARTSLWPII